MPTAHATGRGYSSIHHRVLLTLLTLSLTPLILLGLFCLNRLNNIYEEKISFGIEAVTSSKRRALDTFLDERFAQIKMLVFTHSYAELASPDRLSEIFNVMQSNSRSFIDLGIIDMKGRHVAYVGPYNLRDINYADTQWFQDVRRKGAVMTDVFLGYRNVPHFIIAVLKHEGGQSYIMRATIDMAAIDLLLRRDASTGDAFLVNEKGVLQTRSLFHGKIMDTFSLPDNMVTHKDILTLPLSESGQNGDAQELMAAMVRLNAMPWVLVVIDNLQDTLENLRRLQVLIAFFLLAGGTLIVIGAVFCTGRLMAYLFQADARQAQIDARMLQSSKMAALGKMAAGVAHEINNPLMLIQENAGWIRDLLEDESPEKVQNYHEIAESTQKIEAHVKRAKGITQRMLGFGRRMNPGRTEILLNSLVEQACEMLKAEATNRNIALQHVFDSQLPVILSDPAQLEQVFINIIDNALDAIGKNGTVTITTGMSDDRVYVTFKDTGPGMDEETRRQIFDPFFTTKKVGEGTGLGLAICYSILAKLGGHIEVESRKGAGTIFTITLPHEPPAETAIITE